MRIKNNLILLCSLVIAFSCFKPFTAQGAVVPEIAGQCAILIESTTGKVLYEKNSELKAYPASTTKILTAIIMLEYISIDEIIVIGNEINSIPGDSSKAGHLVGESISGRNLLRGLMLPSGNESGCVVAAEVARRVTGRNNIPYSEAESLFAEIMNEKAKSLGALNSNFVNPHGYHDSLHFTTAYDMALICKEALGIPVFAETASEVSYTGMGVAENATPNMLINSYSWSTTNNLLKPDSEFYYSYAKGIKTGYTGPAGYCLASCADNGELNLISVVFHSEENQRYEDSVLLYDYGFQNFEFKQVQKPDTIIDNVAFGNPMLGEPTNMDVILKGEFTDLFMKEDFDKLVSEIFYDQNKIYIPPEDVEKDDKKTTGVNENAGKVVIKLPVEDGDVLGFISYTIDGAEVYRDDLLATATASERTKESDYEYYKAQFMEFIFSKAAIPYWIGLVVLLLIIILIIISLIRRSLAKRNRYRVNYKHRRY